MGKVAVATSSQIAAKAGAAIAGDGGNAVDAAVAAVLVALCTEVGIIGPGASGFIAVDALESAPVVIDANAEMPGRGLATDRFGRGGHRIWMGYGGGMETIVGWGSVAIPGAFAGLADAHSFFGRVPWAMLFEPVIAIIENGFPLSAASGEYLSHAHDAIYGWDEQSRAVIHPNGKPVAAGDVLRIDHLADTLRRLAADPRDLYDGDLAATAVLASEENAGILTAADLSGYQPVWREPTLIDVDGWRVATNPPPAVGGVTMAAILLLMGLEDLDEWDESTLHRYATIQRAVMRYRREHLDPYGERAERARELLDLARAGRSDDLMRSPSTIHTSAVDDGGLGIAITLSAGYGSGAMIPGTGFWMNNSLGEVELTGEGFHSLDPGTRLVSNMAPTLARRENRSVMSLGSPGADRITTAIASVLLNHLHLGMPLQQAVDFPRMHVETFEGQATIAHERGLPVTPFDDFITREFEDLSMYFGGVAAATWTPDGGVEGAADPRRDCAVAIAGVPTGT